MHVKIVAAIAITLLQITSIRAETTIASDPTTGFGRLFGLGGRACKQYDDTGRLFLYTEGLPPISIGAWL